MYTISNLTEDYRKLFNFIYENEDWKELQKTRIYPHVMYRHIVRAIILEFRECTLKELGSAEGKLLGTSAKDHTTIIHSIRFVEEELTPSWTLFKKQLSIYYKAHLRRQQSKFKEGIIEKTKELLKSTPERNAFLLASVIIDFQLEPDLHKVLKSSFDDYKVTDQFLHKMLNELETA